jgi:hypothetical protein
MDKESWQAMPSRLRLRQITYKVRNPGCRSEKITVVTTLLDPKLYPRRSFQELYKRRWYCELFLRDLKTTMSMEELRCESVEMVHKELSMFLLAYNLIRAVMAEAAQTYRIDPKRLSFKETTTIVRAWAPRLACCAGSGQTYQDNYCTMLYYIAKGRLPDPKGRMEPRAVKHRPKNYQRLTKPRKEMREIPHRNRYKKAA